MTLNCFKCHAEVIFDSDHIGKNGKKIPLDPATKQPHDCPMREKRDEHSFGSRPTEDKNDHGNELTLNVREPGFSSNAEFDRPVEEKKYVDHTLKGQQKLKLFIGTKDEVEEEYNGYRYVTHGKINVFGTQLAVSDGIIYFALNYEETA